MRLGAAKARGEDPVSYVEPDHPVQQTNLENMATLSGVPKEEIEKGREKMFGEAAGPAEKKVRASLILGAVAEKENIEIRLYSIIYDAIEEIKSAMEGMLEPKVEEKIVCNVEVRDIFKNAFLPYRSPETLKMFLKVFS